MLVHSVGWDQSLSWQLGVKEEASPQTSGRLSPMDLHSHFSSDVSYIPTAMSEIHACVTD